ncbi:MAG: ABC transporter permease [Bacteroidia bacterium]
MRRYIIRRVLVFIPTLFVISLLTFVISVNAPGDPLDQILNKNSGFESQTSNKLAGEKAYRMARHDYGFDLPLFYFDLSSAALPDTLYLIPDLTQRQTLERLAEKYGDWNHISFYYLLLHKLDLDLYQMAASSTRSDLIYQMRAELLGLYDTWEDARIQARFSKLRTLKKEGDDLLTDKTCFAKLESAYRKMVQESCPLKKYIPALHWHGTDNQYHRWFSRFVRGDFGISYQDQRPVSSSIREAWPWTVGISLVSVLLAFLISIPLGVHAAVNKGSLKEKISTTGLFMLYSLPNFWIGTLLVIFLCGGDWLHLFPGPGADPVPADASFFSYIVQTCYHLVLPLICWTYGTLAFISRQMRGGILNVIGQDYIRTARAKGLDEKTVIWKHALRNSLLPVITLFADVFPLSVSGSVVLEHIFNIPGMGQLSYQAFFAKNYPVIFAVLMFTAFLTLFGNLVSDILYALVDPRISFTSTSKEE